MTWIAQTLKVSRSNLIQSSKQAMVPNRRRGYRRMGDDEALSWIKRVVDERPTYGYRRVTAVVNRLRGKEGLGRINHKRVYRLMQRHNMLLARHTGSHVPRVHDGKVITLHSNTRWCSDGYEFTCWNGDIVRGAFIIDTADREIISHCAVFNAGVSGSDVRDMLITAVEQRFGTHQAPRCIEVLTDNGSPYRAKLTQQFVSQLGMASHFTPVASPESNGAAEAFVKTLKRDYLNISPVPDGPTALAQIPGWVEDYNECHPHSGLKMLSPREHRRALKQTA